MRARARAYRAVRRLLQIGVRVFFRRVAVVGLENVPGDGPTIFCGNHPNALLDPVLITASCGRIVRFAAKDTLFGNPLFRVFLSAMGAVPVRRRQEHPDGPLDNRDAFEALFAVLGSGEAMGIFPEGLSHDGSRLAELKTGAARIALGLHERTGAPAPKLVPCGLHYVTRDRFRSSVLIQFGPAIDADGRWLAEAGGDERGAVQLLTSEIERRLRALTVNAEDWETVRVLDGVRRLFQPEGLSLSQRVELARRFNERYPEVRDRPDVRRLFAEVRAYLDRLAADGLRDVDLRHGLGLARRVGRAAAHLVLLAVWLPLALPGAMIHLPVALLLRVTSRQLGASRDVTGTIKFVAGLVLLTAIYVAAPLLAYRLQGWEASVAVGVLLPLTGYAAVRVGERAAAFRRFLRTSWRILRLGREIEELRVERARLVAEVTRAVHAVAPPDLAPIDSIPREDEA